MLSQHNFPRAIGIDPRRVCLATFLQADRTEDQKRWTATYQISAPNGEWRASDAGAYTITLLPGAALDAGGHAADGRILDGFVFEPHGATATSAPYVPEAKARSITRPSFGLFANSGKVVRVDLKLPYPGYRVVDWGRVTRDGNSLAVNADIERVPGPELSQAELHLWHEYEVPDWPAGECSFTFRVHGSAVRTELFPAEPHVIFLSPPLHIPSGVFPASLQEAVCTTAADPPQGDDRSKQTSPTSSIPAPAENALLDVLARDVAGAYATVKKLSHGDALFSLTDGGLSTI